MQKSKKQINNPPPPQGFRGKIKAVISELSKKLDTLAGFCVNMRQDVSKNAGFLADYVVLRTVLMKKGIVTNDELEAEAKKLEEANTNSSKEDSKGESIRSKEG